MSTLNFAILSDELAVVAVDTSTSHGRDISKLYVVPHLGVLAGRGSRMVLDLVLVSLNTLPTLDDGLRLLGKIVDRAVAHVHHTLQAEGLTAEQIDDVLAQQEILLVGVTAAGTLAASVARRDGEEAQLAQGVQSLMSPGMAGKEQMLATTFGTSLLMEMSIAAMRLGGAPAEGLGGRCFVARIGSRPRLKVSVEDLGSVGAVAHSMCATALAT